MQNGSNVSLVTGTSSGIGRLTARALARRGHHVFAAMRDPDSKNAEAAAEMLAWADDEGANVEVVDLDITDTATIDRAVDRMLSSAGRIDVVVNNAGAAAFGLLEPFTIEDLQRLFDVDVFGALRVNRAVLPTMRKQRSGLLIHVSSAMGRIAVPYSSPYSAAKSALEVFAEAYSYELAPLGIDSAIIEPGSYPVERAGSLTNVVLPSDEAVLDEYGDLAEGPQKLFEGLPEQWSAAGNPDPQEVADAIAELIEVPAGSRPLRTVVGELMTAGVRELNNAYDKHRAEMFESVGTTVTNPAAKR